MSYIGERMRAAAADKARTDQQDHPAAPAPASFNAPIMH
jgi:hypothetical protein